MGKRQEQECQARENRLRIAKLMADGRERTADDVANALGLKRQQVSYNMRWMTDNRLLVSDIIGGKPSITVWRAARVSLPIEPWASA